MSSENLQIKVSYEELGMSPEEIAEDRELDINAVKAALMQTSAQYRKACGAEDEDEAALNFSDQDLKQVNEVIKQIAMFGEDDNLRLKAAMYIRDDKKGRKEVVKAVGGQQFNILMFNEAMKQVRGAASEVKQKFINGAPIPV